MVAGGHAVERERHLLGVDDAAEDLGRDGLELGIAREAALELRPHLLLLGRVVAQRPHREDGEGEVRELVVVVAQEAARLAVQPAHVEPGAEHDEVVALEEVSGLARGDDVAGGSLVAQDGADVPGHLFDRAVLACVGDEHPGHGDLLSLTPSVAPRCGARSSGAARIGGGGKAAARARTTTMSRSPE